MLRDAKPGDVYSFEVDPDETPCLGDRLSLVAPRREGAGGLMMTELVQDDNGRWEVVQVGSSGSTANRVRRSVRARYVP